MNLYGEILAKALEGHSIYVTIEGADVQKLVETSCYQALEQIKAVLEDDTLSDPDCFQKIEKIMEVYEHLGSGAGSRHDFG